jgi:hypothetical protein
MKKLEIMSPKNKKWNQFCKRLDGKEGCNFRSTTGDVSGVVWNCKGGEDKTFAKKILKKYYPEIDIKETFKYFDEHGGHCDCEILFNVDNRE